MGTELKSLSECSAAAAYLMLTDTSASSYTYSYRRSYPPFCYYEAMILKFNSGSHTGSCSSSRQCLCATEAGVSLDYLVCA